MFLPWIDFVNRRNEPSRLYRRPSGLPQAGKISPPILSIRSLLVLEAKVISGCLTRRKNLIKKVRHRLPGK